MFNRDNENNCYRETAKDTKAVTRPLRHTLKTMAKFSFALTSLLVASASAFAPNGIQQPVR